MCWYVPTSPRVNTPKWPSAEFVVTSPRAYSPSRCITVRASRLLPCRDRAAFIRVQAALLADEVCDQGRQFGFIHAAGIWKERRRRRARQGSRRRACWQRRDRAWKSSSCRPFRTLSARMRALPDTVRRPRRSCLRRPTGRVASGAIASRMRCAMNHALL